MEQAPHFGAIPSAGDVQKKKAQQVTDAEWREQFVEELCQPDALLRLQRLEQNDSAKADKIKAELFRMASRRGAGKAAKDTPFSDATEIAPGSIAPGSVKKAIGHRRPARGAHREHEPGCEPAEHGYLRLARPRARPAAHQRRFRQRH